MCMCVSVWGKVSIFESMCRDHVGSRAEKRAKSNAINPEGKNGEERELKTLRYHYFICSSILKVSRSKVHNIRLDPSEQLSVS